jgi:hypothetical protein
LELGAWLLRKPSFYEEGEPRSHLHCLEDGDAVGFDPWDWEAEMKP